MQGNMADGNKDLYIHWGYLNVLQLCDNTGKKLKRCGWRTFWTDLFGSTLRLYEDTSLPSSKNNTPPSTLIGPRPEDERKHAFFCLKRATVKDFDSNKYFESLNVPRLARKNTFQIILPDSSAYLLQAPSMAAFYRWLTKIQSSIDNADEPWKLYDKMAVYEQRRYHNPREPTYPEPPKPPSEEEEPCDPHTQKLKEKLREKQRLLRQLERQEMDFLNSENEGTIHRIEFAATAKMDYYLVPGRAETLIAAGKTFTVFGLLPNGRWRCFAETDTAERGSVPGRIPAANTPNTCEGSDEGVDIDDNATYPYPLIGSVPTSAILELTQPSRIKNMVDSMSVSSDISIPETPPPPDTPPPDIPPPDIPLLDTPFTPFRSTTDLSPEPYSSHRPPSRSATISSTTASPPHPSSLHPLNPPPTGNFGQLMARAVINSDSSTLSGSSPSLPATPTSPCETSVIGDLNLALESLTMLTPRTRLSSGVSSCSANSTSSQDDYSSSDMYRGSLLMPFDDNCTPEPNTVGVVRVRKRRDIHITKKLHARGISLVVGSSSSSEDEDECEPRNKDNHEQSTHEREKDGPSRKIEELHASKEKLTDKVFKGTKSVSESTAKPPSSIDRGNLLDNPTLNRDLLREFSDNSYGLPTRNSVTQAQFKPLASHEIPPPLHQRRTLQMTRKENEGFGFVLQTHSVVETGKYADTMTFVSNVSEDGPAYLAGMRPGDIIIEIESANVEDDDKGIIVETLKSSGVTVRLVVVYKDAIRRMRLVTRLMALKACLKEKEAAYEALERKEQAIQSRVKDPSVVEANMKVAIAYIHIQTASTTFARDTPDVKNAVTQNRRTPTELLQAKQPALSELSRLCGVPTRGFGLVREFASCNETDAREEPTKALAPTSASDTALNTTAATTTKKRKTLKQCQRSSFISYVDIEVDTQNVEDSRRRIRSEGDEPKDDELPNFEGFVEKEEKPIKMAALAVQPSLVRPESYMFAVGTNSINAYPLNSLVNPRGSGAQS